MLEYITKDKFKLNVLTVQIINFTQKKKNNFINYSLTTYF